jgi:exopolysaccharide biosynthesis predicted pyruvyltransferase EpsI
MSKLQEKVSKRVEVILDHDTALNLTKDDFKINVPKKNYVLYCIRGDKEMNRGQDYNFLSKWIDAVTYSRTFEEWLSLHAAAKRIITNRLHSAIIGSVLEIPTVLLPNSYHKNRAVWEFSLKPRHVKWHEKIPVSSLSRTLNQIEVLKKIRQSRVCQRLIGQMI